MLVVHYNDFALFFWQMSFLLILVSTINKFLAGRFWPFPKGQKHELFIKQLIEQWKINKGYVLASANNSIVVIISILIVLGTIGAKFNSCKYGRCGIDYFDLIIFGFPIIVWAILKVIITFIFDGKTSEILSKNSKKNVDLSKSEGPVDFWLILLLLIVIMLVIGAMVSN